MLGATPKPASAQFAALFFRPVLTKIIAELVYTGQMDLNAMVPCRIQDEAGITAAYTPISRIFRMGKAVNSRLKKQNCLMFPYPGT